ncbi:MAG: alpha-1,2-fucosyltransferase, partial [Bacteroidetes bacterium]|nr:alpha-1,2-fucosyltransferase [Bacteroidota bacterium]
MIVVKLMGGIGNQMFQYSFAKQLSLKQGVDLKLDISELNGKLVNEKYSIRDFELNNFNINASVASENEIKAFQKNKFGKLMDLVLLYLPFNNKKRYIREPYFRFFKKALSVNGNAYLDGYWQTEKYFEGIRIELLKDFTLKTELSEKSKEIANKVLTQQAVSIHVRKGDYLSIEENKSLFAV